MAVQEQSRAFSDRSTNGSIIRPTTSDFLPEAADPGGNARKRFARNKGGTRRVHASASNRAVTIGRAATFEADRHDRPNSR